MGPGRSRLHTGDGSGLDIPVVNAAAARCGQTLSRNIIAPLHAVGLYSADAVRATCFIGRVRFHLVRLFRSCEFDDVDGLSEYFVVTCSSLDISIRSPVNNTGNT